MDDCILLRVHSEDLHDHVAQEVGECLESGLYTDLMVRCKGGETLHAHKLVLSAASPFLRSLLESNDWEEVQTLELPDVTRDVTSMLLDLVYIGVIEATIEDLRSIILLAHSLYITIPLSDDLLETLELTLPAIPLFNPKTLPKLKIKPSFQPPVVAKQHSFKSKPPQHPKIPTLKLKIPAEVSNLIKNAAPLNASSPEKSKRPEHTCPICKTTYSNIGNFKLHMKSHDNDHLRDQRNLMLSEIVATCYNKDSSLYTCNICGSNYNHSGNFKQHLLKHEREAGSISAMLVTEGRESLGSSANSHLSKALKSAITDRVVRVDHGDKPGRRPLYECEHCGRSFNHAGNFKQHMASHSRTSESQTSSSKRSRSSSSRMASLKVQVSCPHCSLEFPSVDLLEEHITFIHKQSSAESDEDEEFDDGEVDPIHTEVQEPVKTIPCSSCPEMFEDMVAMHRHQLTYHPDDFNAILDNSIFNTFLPISGRKPGRPAMVQERVFTCEECGKVFHKRRKLTAHLKIHSAPEQHYRYPCDICGKKFTRQQHVNRHKLLHTGERPYVCKMCDKAFAREDKLKHHIRTECDQNMSGGIGHEMDDNDIDDNDNNGAVGFDMNDPLIGFDDNGDVDMAAGILSN